MSKYDVTHTCGCEKEYTLFGKHSERERKLGWLATQECPRCRNKSEGPVAIVKQAPEFTEISVINSFEVREQLKDREYRFSREVFAYPGNDLLKSAMQQPLAGWVLRVASAAQAADEMEWIAAQGWSIRNLGLAGALVAAVIEGRPSLAGLTAPEPLADSVG